jgi:hypothetical protein
LAEVFAVYLPRGDAGKYALDQTFWPAAVVPTTAMISSMTSLANVGQAKLSPRPSLNFRQRQQHSTPCAQGADDLRSLSRLIEA